jgi:hypothetical protein
MLKKIGPVAIAITALLAAGACSKTADPVNTQAGGSTPSTTAAPGTTEAPATTRSPGTTQKKSTGTTQTHSTGTSKSSGTQDFDLTADEQQCITDAVTADPSLQTALQDTSSLTPEQAGIIGGLVANCVPKPKLADALVSGLKNSSDGKDLTQSDLSCIRDQIISLDTSDLAVFVGLIAYSSDSGDKSVAASTISKLNSACGTNIPA